MSAMTYKEPACRQTPGCVIFLLDHSYSMTEGLAGSKRSKRDALATAINRFLFELILKSEKQEGVLHYFDVGVISYTTDQTGKPIIGSALKGDLAGRELVSTVELYENPIRVEEKVKMVDDGVGGLIERPVKMPIWYEVPPEKEMAGTPMSGGLGYVKGIAENWCATHSTSFPPVVIHITDGEPTGPNPDLNHLLAEVEQQADALRRLETTDGSLLLFNCHLSKSPVAGVLFPPSEDELPADPYAHLLFRISSPLPDIFRMAAEMQQASYPPGTRGMAFNADGVQMLTLIKTGTPATGPDTSDISGIPDGGTWEDAERDPDLV